MQLVSETSTNNTPVAHYVEAEFERLMRTSVRYSAMTLMVVYSVMTVLHPLALSGRAGMIMASVAATTVVLLAGLWWLTVQNIAPDRWMNQCGFAVSFLALLNCSIHLVLIPAPEQTTNFILVILGTGFSFFSLRWFVLSTGPALIFWSIAVWFYRSNGNWLHFGFALAFSTAIALITLQLRRNSYSQIFQLQQEQARNNEEMAQTLREMELARTEAEQSKEQFEQALQCAMESEQRYRSLVDNSQALVCTHDFQGKLLTVNPSFARNLRYAGDDLVGRNIRELLTEDVRALFSQYMQMIRENQADSGVMRVMTKDGEERYWSYQNTVCLEEGKPAYILGSAQDMTKRIRAERELRKIQAELEMRVSERTQELRDLNDALQKQIVERERISLDLAEREAQQAESSRFYEQLIQSAGEGIVVYDAQARYLLWNRRMEALTGVRANQISGTSAISRLQQLGVEEYFKRALQGEIITLPDRSMETSDGQTLWVSSTYTPYQDGEGKVTGVISIIREITSRRQIEQERQQYTEKLKRSHRELEELAGIATHDLQEPLRKIRTFIYRLMQRDRECLSEQGQHDLGRIEKIAGHMQRLLDDLLLFTHVTTQALPFASVNFQEVTEEVIQELQPQIAACQAQITVSSLPIIEADAWQVRQLLLNLIGNALKYARSDVRPQIVIRSSVSGQTDSGVRLWRIEIADNGIGFDKKYLDRIFNLFERLHPQAKYEGTGVGLALCRRIVERHNGELTAESRIGEGSVFFITLPEQQQQSLPLRQRVSPGAK
jgi:PAS domain S-box-containing protein